MDALSKICRRGRDRADASRLTKSPDGVMQPFSITKAEWTAINQKVTKLMSTESDLQAAMASIQSDFAAYQTSVATEFTTLTAQIAALNAQSGPVTQAQLDALVSQAQAVDTAIKAAPVAPAA